MILLISKQSLYVLFMKVSQTSKDFGCSLQKYVIIWTPELRDPIFLSLCLSDKYLALFTQYFHFILITFKVVKLCNLINCANCICGFHAPSLPCTSIGINYNIQVKIDYVPCLI